MILPMLLAQAKSLATPQEKSGAGAVPFKQNSRLRRRLPGNNLEQLRLDDKFPRDPLLSHSKLIVLHYTSSGVLLGRMQRGNLILFRWHRALEYDGVASHINLDITCRQSFRVLQCAFHLSFMTDVEKLATFVADAS